MIGYVTLGTNDRERSAKFYDAVCGELGVGRMMEFDEFIAWGKPDGGAGIGLTRPFDGKEASVGNGVMVAFEAKDREQVARLHEIALAHGGSDEGEPGPRGDPDEHGNLFYAAYFRDPDGNKLNAFLMEKSRLMADKHRLADSFLHLGLGATAVPQPPFAGMEWYEEYGKRHGADGAEGRLVSWHSFAENWDAWEMHPKGAEVVLCVEGRITLHQEEPDGAVGQVTLEPGEYAINAPGVWHTADVADHATAIFITAGEGTQHRPR